MGLRILGTVVRRVRALWRAARRLRILRPLITGIDRLWWARVIRSADLVDLDFVAAQGRAMSTRQSVRAYVRGGFRSGLSLNPLFTERLVSRQLSDADRVPALYAYLVNDARSIRTSIVWDTVSYAQRHPESVAAPGGPVGHAWRSARTIGTLDLGFDEFTTPIDWVRFRSAVLGAARASRSTEFTPAPDSPTTSLVFVCRVGANDDLATILDLTIAAARLDADLVVAVGSVDAEIRVQCALLALWIPRLAVCVDRDDLLADVESARDDGAVLVVRGPSAEITAADFVELARRGADGSIAPLWVSVRDGTIASAGIVTRAGSASHFLAAHPVEDAQALGSTITVRSIAGATFARPVRSARTPGRTALDLVVRAPAPTAALDPIPGEDSDLRLLLAAGGLEVGGWGARGPVLFRSRSTSTLADGVSVPSLRWAIKIAAPPGRAGEAWGDTHYARGLADALRRLGQEVVIDAYDARMRRTAHLDDVVLALRGPEPIRPQTGATSIMWIISHPDEITARDLDGFDLVYAASEAWATSASRDLGRTVVPLLQCTDPNRFHPQGLTRGEDLIFVGTARGIPRPSIIEPIRAGIPVSVYGPDWSGWIPGSAIRARGVANSMLPPMYESAGAVLNDHWPAMRDAGFVSNRLYDVVAAGGRAISDRVDGIDRIFEGAVQTYRDIPHLLAMLSEDLDRLFPEEDQLSAISARIRKQHSYDARARVLLDAVIAH